MVGGAEGQADGCGDNEVGSRAGCDDAGPADGLDGGEAGAAHTGFVVRLAARGGNGFGDTWDLFGWEELVFVFFERFN